MKFKKNSHFNDYNYEDKNWVRWYRVNKTKKTPKNKKRSSLRLDFFLNFALKHKNART